MSVACEYTYCICLCMYNVLSLWVGLCDQTTLCSERNYLSKSRLMCRSLLCLRIIASLCQGKKEKKEKRPREILNHDDGIIAKSVYLLALA